MGTAEIIMAIRLGAELLMEVIDLISLDGKRTLSAEDRQALRDATQKLVDRANAL